MNLEVDGEQALIHNIWQGSKVLPSFEPCQRFGFLLLIFCDQVESAASFEPFYLVFIIRMVQ
jgi:hypothetical protein